MAQTKLAGIRRAKENTIDVSAEMITSAVCEVTVVDDSGHGFVVELEETHPKHVIFLVGAHFPRNVIASGGKKRKRTDKPKFQRLG